MDTQAMQRTIGQDLMWVNYMFGTTKQVCESITDNLLDWRPEDPTGEWQFSIAEIAMHIIDARRMFSEQLTGVDLSERYYCPDYWAFEDPQPDGSYKFKPYGSLKSLLDELQKSKQLFDPFLAEPKDKLTMVPDGALTWHQKIIAQLKDAGQDPTPIEVAGPPSILHVLFMTIAHESGHRGTLNTLLRINGAIEPED